MTFLCAFRGITFNLISALKKYQKLNNNLEKNRTHKVQF